jgi:hypothetical protein
VVKSTNQKQALAWTQFKDYLLSIGCQGDPFLEQFSSPQRHKILAAFAHAIQEGRFNSRSTNPVKAESVRAAMDHVTQAFKLVNHPDPRLDNDGRFAFFLQCQLKFYSKNDKPVRQQEAFTGPILKEFYKLSKSSNSDRAMCELFIGAFFFAMRSCEYIKVSGHRKTKLLTLANIRFFTNNRLVQHNDKHLHLSECISITFEFQKCDTKYETITQHKSGDIRRILSYPLSNTSTTVNTYMKPDNTIHYFSGTELLRCLRLATTSIGSDILGFSAKEKGLHSARSGAAMAMYLTRVPVFTIMLLGRWSSDAFFCYIRSQRIQQRDKHKNDHQRELLHYS